MKLNIFFKKNSETFYDWFYINLVTIPFQMYKIKKYIRKSFGCEILLWLTFMAENVHSMVLVETRRVNTITNTL